jgi:hypothetical protein
MKVIEFPKQTGARLAHQQGWRVQPPPIRIQPAKRETLPEFLGIVSDPEFQKSVGRILAAEAFSAGQAGMNRSSTEGVYRRCGYGEAGRVFDFLLETARFDHRDRQAAAQQYEYHRRKFARHVSAEAVNALRQLLAQGKGWQTEPVAPESEDSVAAFHRRRRTLRQVSRGVDPRVAAERARHGDDYRKWVLSTNTGAQSANQAEALLRGGLVNYKEYISHRQVSTTA